jgi:hypothetical protein
MTLRVDLRIGEECIGTMSIGRLTELDLTDRDALEDVVSPYRVRINGTVIGSVEHRYGDGAWVLVFRALQLPGVPRHVSWRTDG